MNESLMYTVEEAAELLGIGRNLAYDGVRSGEIPAVRIGTSWRVPKASLDALLNKSPRNPDESEPHQQQTILKMPPRIRQQRERKVGINAHIPVSLNNKIVESAIARGVTLSEEIRVRLQESFAEPEK